MEEKNPFAGRTTKERAEIRREFNAMGMEAAKYAAKKKKPKKSK